MVGVFSGLHAPVESRTKVVLERFGPTSERVVTICCAVPGVDLVRPIVIEGRVVLVPSIAARPTAPAWLLRLVHPGRHQIEKRHGVSLFLPMCGVRRIERAQWAMTGKHIAH